MSHTPLRQPDLEARLSAEELTVSVASGFAYARFAAI